MEMGKDEQSSVLWGGTLLLQSIPKNAQYYTVTDLYLGAYLHYHGCEIQRVDRTKPRLEFVFFHESFDMEELADDYIRGKAIVRNAQTFVESIKFMKNLIHSPTILCKN